MNKSPASGLLVEWNWLVWWYETSSQPALQPNAFHFVILDFFVISNKSITDNLSQNFMTEVLALIVQFFYGFQLKKQWNILPTNWHMYQRQMQMH